MTRIFLIIAFLFATGLAACGPSGQSVTRNDVDTLGFAPYAAQYTGGTSARTSVDLLSLN
ncbi:MAG: hypothetical protein AB3N17_13445 [Tateyamaria sp.]